MRLSTIGALSLLNTSLISAAATTAPGFHNIGDSCAEAQVGEFGCSLDGSREVACELNLLQLKGLFGQTWEGEAGCIDKAENSFGVCRCDSSGGNCGCVVS